MTAAFIYHFTEPYYFLDGVLDKFLTAESGIHTHQQHHIHILDNFFQYADRRRRVQRYAGFHPGSMYLLYGTVQMRARLIMYIHHHRSYLFGSRDISLRMNNHKVDIERFLTNFGHSFHHWKAERYIGYKDTIHDIQVKPVGLTPVDHFNVTLQIKKVCSQ